MERNVPVSVGFMMKERCPSTERGIPDLVTRLFLRSLAIGMTRRRRKKWNVSPDSAGDVAADLAAEQARALAALRRMANRPSFPLRLSSLPLCSVTDLSVPGPAGPRPARLYLPRGTVRGAVLYLHGGGFVHCGLNSHHGICCRLARASGAAVLSLDYRLAPEHRFPAAFDDSWAALEWLAVEARKWGGGLAVAGDSAGGTLAAALAQEVRNRRRAVKAGRPDVGFCPDLALQVLFYPATHGALEFPSRRDFASGYFLTMRMLEWYGQQYAACLDDVSDKRFSPGLAEDLEGVAPALIVTAEFDPLRDEAETYGKALRDAGVPVHCDRVRGAIHGFLNFYPIMPKAGRALRVAGRALRDTFGSFF